MCCVKAKIISVILGATGTNSVIQTLPEQHTGKTQNQGTTDDNRFGHCTHTKDSTNVKVRNIFHVRNNIMCSTNYKYRTAATLCTLET